MVRDAIADEAAGDLLVASPDFHFVEAAKDGQSDGTKVLLKEARRSIGRPREPSLSRSVDRAW